LSFWPKIGMLSNLLMSMFGLEVHCAVERAWRPAIVDDALGRIGKLRCDALAAEDVVNRREVIV
jgi:hypothetical protein